MSFVCPYNPPQPQRESVASHFLSTRRRDEEQAERTSTNPASMNIISRTLRYCVMRLIFSCAGTASPRSICDEGVCAVAAPPERRFGADVLELVPDGGVYHVGVEI